MLNKTPLLHQRFGPHVFSLSLFFRLILWSAEALWVHFPAQASKTLSRRCSAPSPHREGAWGLREQSKPRGGALSAFCINQGISASFSHLYFLIGRLRTTRFRSIKGPQQVAPEQEPGTLGRSDGVTAGPTEAGGRMDREDQLFQLMTLYIYLLPSTWKGPHTLARKEN